MYKRVCNPQWKLIINDCFKLDERRDSGPGVSGDNTEQCRKVEPWMLVERKPSLTHPSTFWWQVVMTVPEPGSAGEFLLRYITGYHRRSNASVSPGKKCNRKQTILIYGFVPPLTFFPFSALLYLEQFQIWPAISSKETLNKLPEENCCHSEISLRL